MKKEGVRLSDGRIRELADAYLEEAVDALAPAGQECRLRETLAAEGVAPESVEGEIARIMDVLTPS